jgi:hypothetical protein
MTSVAFEPFLSVISGTTGTGVPSIAKGRNREIK